MIFPDTQPALDLVAILLFAGVAQGILLAATLLTVRRGNRTANRILSALLGIFVVHIVLQTLHATNYLFQFPHFSKSNVPLAFLIGPLFYWYVRALTERDFRLEKKLLWQCLPALGIALWLFPFYIQSAETKIQVLTGDLANLCRPCVMIAWLTMIHLLIYFIAAARQLLQHTRNIKAAFSSLEKINLTWLRTLLLIYAADWILALAMQIRSGDAMTANLLWLFVSIVMYVIGYMGLRQPEIFAGIDESTNGRVQKKKYEKSTLAPGKAEEYHPKLLQLMAAEKPYLNSALNLPNLAKRLSISSHHLSQIINERLQQNFFEFVNGYRVDEARRLLHEPAQRHLNIAQIGYDAGFSSTSAFNAAFKKHAGTTPSQFRQRQLI